MSALAGKGQHRRSGPVRATVVVLAVAAGLSSCNMAEAMEEADRTRKLQMRTPPLAELSPGTYRGSYDAGMVSAEVQAVVAEGAIAELVLLRHDTWRGGDAEVLIDRIVEEQSLELEAVTGATISSKTILKATEVALSGES